MFHILKIIHNTHFMNGAIIADDRTLEAKPVSIPELFNLFVQGEISDPIIKKLSPNYPTSLKEELDINKYPFIEVYYPRSSIIIERIIKEFPLHIFDSLELTEFFSHMFWGLLWKSF